uniref:Uncharacterized protein n=1 Tax=Timspurckia oligopyrenoides TaxID=708627 RepID=A0A7S1EU00_9RHOD|mmetsp:Transcript_7248/g.13093  ORF Transcript_7248/g.13093 Transcript_7248/m.13093 type:complete len:102 (+) Transcript_7248:232-537(+)
MAMQYLFRTLEVPEEELAEAQKASLLYAQQAQRQQLVKYKILQFKEPNLLMRPMRTASARYQVQFANEVPPNYHAQLYKQMSKETPILPAGWEEYTKAENQ